jgi:hypoxanthine-guanine phosphoribosyltransferase
MAIANRKPVSRQELIDMGRRPRRVFAKEPTGKSGPWITERVMQNRVAVLLEKFLAPDVLRRQVDDVVVVGVAEGGLYFQHTIAKFIENKLNRTLACGRVIRTSWKTIRVRSTHSRINQGKPHLSEMPSDLDQISDRLVILVDDIADTGETLEAVTEKLREHGPAEILSIVCLCKSWTKFLPDYAAFLIPDHVIAVGWGMDAGMGVGRANNAIWNIASYLRRMDCISLIDEHLIQWAEEIGNHELLELAAERSL